MADASDKPGSRSSVRFGSKVSERSKVISEEENPLSKLATNDSVHDNYPKVKKENLTIRLEDEARIVAGMSSAAKKQTTGAIFSVVVDISKTGTLGIGVKDLSDNILAVSMLKRENNQPGPGEEAGIRLGDIIFGINFVPTREGSRTLINVIKKETQKQRKILHIQGWRCHQLCSDNIPGYLFPRADEVIVQAYSLFRTKVFSDWERWNFIEILLGHMIEDLKLRTNQQASTIGASIDESGRHVSNQSRVRAKQMQVLDLERNILQAKGLRTAICVRIVHTKSHNETVIYVLRVEDVESGLQWVVHRRFRDFFALNDELLDMSHFAKEAEFPRKRISIRNTNKLVENRIVALEQYVRKMLHTLTLYATMDSAASRSLRHLQNFLGVDRYVDCVHPPLVDDQRYIELMAYRFLNDFSSPACQQCVRFITSIDLDCIVETGPEGYRPVLTLVKDALAEVEQFVQQQHQQQMIQTLRDRRPDLDSEQLRSFVRKCIRRQVEAALYLPLRRNVFRIVYSFVAQKSKQMQRSMTLLQQATPNYLMVDAYVQQAQQLPVAVKAFRRVIQAYLPADQGQLLVEAAASVTELHRECHMEKQRVKAAASGGSSVSDDKSTASSEARLSGGGSNRGSRNRTNSGGSGGGNGSAKPPVIEIDVKRRMSGSSTNGSGASPVHSQQSGSGRDVRRNSLSGFFRSKSGNSVPPSSATTTPTNGGSKHVDLAGKEALADPVGTIFHAAEDESLQSVGHSIPGNQRQPSISDGEGPDEECDDAADRVSFSVSAHDLVSASSPRKVTVNTGRQNSTGSAHSAAAIRSLSTAQSTPASSSSAAGGTIGTPASQEERSQLTQSAVDQLNTAIFDNLASSAAETDGTFDGEPAVDGDGSTDEQFAHLQRHKSVKISSLLNEMLDIRLDDDNSNSNSNSNSNNGGGGGGGGGSDTAQQQPPQSSGSAPLSSSCYNDSISNSIAEANEEQRQRRKSEVALFADIEDAPSDSVAAVEGEGSVIINSTAEVQHEVISADDFLPLFTFVLVQAGLPQLLLVKELMVALVDDEDTYGECGYYLATLEAATQHICDLADQYEKVARIDTLFDDGEDIFEHFEAHPGSGGGTNSIR